MTGEHKRLSGGNDCVEDQDCQANILPRTSISNDNMLAYTHFGNREQALFPQLPVTSASTSSTHEPYYTPSLGRSGVSYPTTAQQYAYHPQYDFSNTIPDLPYLPRTRSSLQINPFTTTMEPQMMFKQEPTYSPFMHDYYDHSAFEFSPSSCSPNMMSSTTASPSLQYNTHQGQYYSPPMWPHNLSAFTGTDASPSTGSTSDGYEDEDEGIYDKPYAQLIYEALLKAPGHRMLLRDIYEWFITNTRKPRESGTNGWQNSIRHNLSMNQAFENDKNDPAASRGARKANSVWVLTEYAIKHGVQSTTRYRKTGASRKGVSNRAPVIQRQRSGAKGGRAARRAARMKRQGEGQRVARTSQPECEAPAPFHFAQSLSPAQDQWSTCGYSPATPTDDQGFTPGYSLPHRSCYDFNQEYEEKYETNNTTQEDDEHLRQILSELAG